MANTLTSLIPTIYAALDVVSRELVGFIPAVSRDSSDVERAALNQSVLVPIVPAASTGENTPAVTPPDTGDQTIGNTEITISKSKHVPIRWNGEQTKGMLNAGSYNKVLQDQFSQAFRTLTNLIEVDLGSTYKFGSRAVGLAGTAPFATAGNFTDAANVRRILDENGAPQSDLQLVLSHSAMANLRGVQSSLFKVNEAGSDAMLREGRVDSLQGFAIRSSGQVATHTIGTADADYDVDLLAGYAVGDTTVHLDTGTGTHVDGDVITFAGDPNNYVIGTGAAGNGDKDLVLNQPGLRQTLADGVSCDIADDASTWKANLAFHRSAIVLATRLPAMPQGGDSAEDMITVVDPVSGLAFEIAVYRQFLQVSYHVRIAWGWKAIKPAHIAVLMG